jgi:hypothetical protein
LQLDPAARPGAIEFSRHLHAAADSFNPAKEPVESERSRRLVLLGGVSGLVLITALAALFWVRSQREVVTTAPPPSPRGLVSVSVQRTPDSTQLYVDGRQATQPDLQLEPGPHRLIAVARGHYGQIQAIQVPPATPLQVELQPTQLPSLAEFRRFLDLADAPHITAAERDSVTETTLRTALNTKLLRETADHQTLQTLESDLQALAEVGDARAAVILLLAPAIQAGRIAPETIDSRLTAAADGGDAMASFFTAQTLRSRVLEATARGKSAAGELQAYCERLTQAAVQGWAAVATDSQKRDGCK